MKNFIHTHTHTFWTVNEQTSALTPKSDCVTHTIVIYHRIEKSPKESQTLSKQVGTVQLSLLPHFYVLANDIIAWN